LRGGSVDVKLGLQILLYSYCRTFHIDPHEAKDIPIKTIMDYMLIHGEVEKMKSQEQKKEMDRLKKG
tara:strand:- start:87 stop:287 length:201 start_codon:yes stop_codon:yes gene_type:complete